jgi:Protein of unknown function (DUF3187)
MLLTSLGMLLLASAAAAAEPAFVGRRGPVEIPDEHLLAQPRLTLTATSPDTLGRGRWLFGTTLVWGNSFSWNQSRSGEDPQDRVFLIDGEAGSLYLKAERGLRDDLDVGVRLPLKWRGGGFMDGIIDFAHRSLAFLNIPDGKRPKFRRDAFRVILRRDGQRVEWEERGAGLGDVEIHGRWRLRDGQDGGWGTAVVVRGTLPTGTGAFQVGGFNGAVQLVAAKSLGRKWDLFAGAGGTAWSRGAIDGVTYARRRAHVFLAGEWRPLRWSSLSAEANYATRLGDQLTKYPTVHSLLHVSATADLSRRERLVLGFTEAIADQDGTIDFAVHLGVVLLR